MSVTAVRTPAEYESELRRYLYDRSEESRAVRVGEKEISERAEIIARYRDLFSREQLDALRSAEEDAPRGDELEAEISRQPDAIARNEEEKGVSLHELEAALAQTSERSTGAYVLLRDRWFERLLGPEREQVPSSYHVAYLRRLSPLESTYAQDRAVEVCLDTI